MRVHFSNLILLFLSANVLLGLQFIPILRVSRWDEEPKLHNIGSGWPMHCSDSFGNIYFGEFVFDAMYSAALLYWILVLLEKRNENLRLRPIEWIAATPLALIIFGGMACRNSFETGSPWYDGWRVSLFLFFTGLMVATVVRYISSSTVDYLVEKVDV